METGHFIQLIIGVALAVIAFVAAYTVSANQVMFILLIAAPFELISSSYGTSSTGLVYLVATSLLLRNKMQYFPLIGSVLFILFIYVISLSMADVRKLDHIFYIIRIIPGFVVFYVAYNYVREHKEPVKFLYILFIINLFVIIICTLQFTAGSQQVALFGIKEFSLMANRELQGRFSGPFGAEFTSEYMALANLLIAYALMNKNLVKHWPVWLLWGMFASNFGFMVATGSRGGILVFILGLLWGAYLFRREMGVARIIKFYTGAIIIASLMFVVIVQFTNFNVLVKRLEGTEVSEGVLDSRSVTWPTAWKAIEKNPFLGYGPRLRLHEDMVTSIPGHKPIPYPHSLPLFLLYTLGPLGLVAYIIFFVLLLRRLYVGSKGQGDSEMRGLSLLGFLILSMFLIDEIKIEFLRFTHSDYQSIIFTILGGFLGISDRARMSLKNKSADNDMYPHLLK